MKLLLFMYVGSGLLLILIAIPLILHWIKPNGLYGFRVPATLNNEELWYQVNAYSGKRFIVVGVVTILSAVGLYLIPGLTVDVYALLCLGIFVTVLTLCTIQCVFYLRALQNK